MTPDLSALAAPFPPELVSWRVGSTTGDKQKGMALAYIDARDVMVRLDDVCGPAGWQCRYPHAGQKTICEIGIKIGDEWVWKANGAGDTDVEAEKGASSDAFKRAAVLWGIGRYLYDLPSPWVELKAVGRSYAIEDKEHARLEALLRKQAGQPAKPLAAQQPAPATNVNVTSGVKADTRDPVTRIVDMIDAATDAVDLGQKMAHPKTIAAMADMSEADLDRIDAAMKARLGQAEMAA